CSSVRNLRFFSRRLHGNRRRPSSQIVRSATPPPLCRPKSTLLSRRVLFGRRRWKRLASRPPRRWLRPQVTFQNGLLGIRAENSTMGDVLRTVQRATGGLGRYVDTYPIAAARIPLPGSSTLSRNQ